VSLEKRIAARNIVAEASSSLADLLGDLAEPLAEYLLDDYSAEDWQDSPVVESLARVAALLEAENREVPPTIMVALRRAAEAGRPLEVA
jgi:hypothetical protein